jgi:ABC-2 type transport system permease protein
VVAVFILIYRTPVHWTAIWIVPIVALQVLFTLGIGYLVASVNVLYRDMTQLIGLVLMIWMWLSPVMYALDSVPAPIRHVLLMNPLGAVVQAERELLFTGYVTNLSSLWVAAFWACVAFVGGLAVFNRIEPLFAEVM